MKQYILLVDDEDISIFLSKKLLEYSGTKHELAVARNGVQALQLIKSYYEESKFPKIIFLDLNMPIMGGFEFLEKFKLLDYKEDKAMVVIVSSSTDDKDHNRAKDLGAAQFISKPMTLDILRGILK